MMRIEAGRHKVETSDGTTLLVDRELSRSQADVLLRILRDRELDQNVVCAVEFTECGWNVETIA